MPIRNQIATEEINRTAAVKMPALWPRKTPPNHIMMKKGNTMPTEIIVANLAMPFPLLSAESDFDVPDVSLGSPVCCCAAFSRSPPLAMMGDYARRLVMKQSTVRSRGRLVQNIDELKGVTLPSASTISSSADWRPFLPANAAAANAEIIIVPTNSNPGRYMPRMYIVIVCI